MSDVTTTNPNDAVADPAPGGAEAEPPEWPRRVGGHPPHGVRLLVLGWCLWLMGIWGVLGMMGGWTWTVPALRTMVFSGIVGLLGVWPAVRLSQPTGRGRRRDAGTLARGEVAASDWAWACRGVLLDWVCLNLVFQVVLWPLLLVAPWMAKQVLMLGAAIAGWSLLAGLLIAWGRGSDRGAWRVGAMLGCAAVVVLEPALWWLGWQSGSVGVAEMRVSPVQVIWTLSSTLPTDQAAVIVAEQGFQVAAVVAAALSGWAVLGLLLWFQVRRERSRRESIGGAAV
ncbi:MAG: hypothetical protein AAGG38_04730 [Planctomycetota bacterium]